MLRTLLAVLLLLLHDFAAAGVIPPSARAELLTRSLEGFWGRAKTPDGKAIQPDFGEDRSKMPVNEKVANFAFDVGELSGLAEWCGVDWKANFAALTRTARKNGHNEKQVAFVSVTHGVAQGAVFTAMLKSGECSPQIRDKVRSQVEAFLAKEPRSY